MPIRRADQPLLGIRLRVERCSPASVDEIAFLLGHRDANVTRAVYIRELADARRRSMRRSRMIAEFGDLFRSQPRNQRRQAVAHPAGLQHPSPLGHDEAHARRQT
jgi:hypothetical protein